MADSDNLTALDRIQQLKTEANVMERQEGRSSLTLTEPAGLVTTFRVGLAVLGSGLLVLMLGFGFGQDWATRLWRWDDERMSFIFLASIAAAVAAPAFWVAITGELAAWAGVALNGTVVGMLASVYLVSRRIRDLEPGALPDLVIFATLTLVAFAVFRVAHPFPIRDDRAMPRFVRGWFTVFAAILIATGVALLIQVEHIFPWNLEPETSTLFGCFFLGAATYFLYALWRDRWVIAAGALWAFLAYDIVLAVPYVKLLADGDDGVEGLYGSSSGGGEVNELSLALYLLVIGVSTLVALFAFFLHPATRVLRKS
ncbi:MAG: hypothetical protein R2845_16675 [Thermomicrobiales bacterium]